MGKVNHQPAARRRRCETALCALADYEGHIKDVGHKKFDRNFDHAFADVCNALRTIADGEEDEDG